MRQDQADDNFIRSTVSVNSNHPTVVRKRNTAERDEAAAIPINKRSGNEIHEYFLQL